VISHQLWVTDFASDPAVLGQPMVLDRSTYIIVGVAPSDFIGTQVAPVDLWLPLEATMKLAGDVGRLSEPNVSWLQAIGRLSAGTPLPAAAAEATVIAARFDAASPGRHSTINVARATRTGQELLLSHDRGLFIGAATGIWALAGLLLLICGSNVASLMLARGASRQKEFGLRAALGAGRGRIAQQLVAEIGVITGASAMLAVAMAMLSIRVMALWMPTRFITASNTSLHVIGFACVFAAVVALLFGFAPASQAMRADCLSGMKGDIAILGGRLPAARVRQALVSVQMAVSVILLVGAVLLSRGVAQTFSLDPGYATTGIYLVQPDVGSTRAPNLVTDVRDTLAARPGIEVIGLSQHSLFHGVGLSTTTDPRTSTTISLRYNEVDENYFRALGVAPVVGRFFLPREPHVVLVNSSLARKMWGDDRAALNRQIQIPVPDAAGLQTVTIVGVTPTLQTTAVGVADEPTYYAPLSERDRPSALLVVRATKGTPVASLVADAVHAVDSDALPDVTSLDDQIAAATVPARAGAAIAATVGVLALLVAAVGIHGIVAHAVTARTRDIGVHLALGATRSRVLRFVLAWAFSGVAFGSAAGLAVIGVIGLALAGPMRRIMLGIHPLDPVALLIAVGFLGLAILVAAYVPARRALRIEPLAALRHE
jgi:predicted permease